MSEGFKRQLESAVRNAGADSSAMSAEASLDTEKIKGIAGAEAWTDIESMQDEKRALMMEYREWRKKFWHAEGAHRGEREEALPRIKQFELGESARGLRKLPDGRYEASVKGGDALTLTKGEVFAAAEWGTWWKMDDSVSHEDQLGIMGAQVRAKIADRYDDQLIAFGKNDRLSDDRKRDAYARMESSQQSLDSMPDGILAEKMLVSFLTKMMHDSDVIFTVERADAHDDIEYKMDFVITVASGRRGVRVGEPVQRIGIQFTMNTGATAHKQEQVSRVAKRIHETEVDEVVLVTMPIADVRTNFERWRYDEKGQRINDKRLDPRGPDMFWSEETKRTIVEGLLSEIERAHISAAA